MPSEIIEEIEEVLNEWLILHPAGWILHWEVTQFEETIWIAVEGGGQVAMVSLIADKEAPMRFRTLTDFFMMMAIDRLFRGEA